MGINSTLLKSILVATLSWWVIGLAAFYALPPSTIESVTSTIPYIDVPIDITISSALFVQNKVIIQWAGLVLVAWVTTMFASIIIVLIYIAALWAMRRKRGLGRGVWRGVSISQGVVPTPQYQAVPTAKIHLPGIKITHEVKALVNAAMGLLIANKGAYAGDGHGVDLLEHTQNVINAALNKEGADPLLAVCAVAHDIGKLTSFENRNGIWIPTKLHDKESALIISRMPEWWNIREPERSIIIMAIKHYHAPQNIPLNLPGIESDDISRLNQLVYQLREIDGMATKEEKAAVLKDLPLPEILLNAFMDVIRSRPFQIPRLPKGVEAIGWRQGTRLYLIEHRIRDEAMRLLDADTAAALGKHYRNGNITQFTVALFDVLHEKGWLVTKNEEDEIEDHKTALWDIRAGKLVIKAVIIVEMPEALIGTLGNTRYELDILNPHFKKKLDEKQIVDKKENSENGRRKARRSKVSSSSQSSNELSDSVVAGLMSHRELPETVLSSKEEQVEKEEICSKELVIAEEDSIDVGKVAGLLKSNAETNDISNTQKEPNTIAGDFDLETYTL